MPLITKKNIKHIIFSKWPNPYNLTEKDAKGKLEDVPLEIITLILKEMCLQGKTDCLYKAQNLGISSNLVFDWDKSKDGSKFWSDIWCHNRYDVFYDKYTPKSLAEELKKTK